MAPEVEIEEIVEIEAPRMVAQPVEARSSDDLGFGNGDEQRNREAGDSREENGAKDVDSEGEGDGEEGEEEVRTVVFSTPEEAAECESQPLPDPDGDEPVEEIDLSKWDVPNWQVLIDSLYRPDR
ncbi:MAG: hypothetical protein EXR99_15455 [Gemmataceae bacterium]|nr:hypothetical protein [Gemmataceae bacterium]